jgi:hypothetical protein
VDENTLTQLKILVERAVRPVRASNSRKRKMREEMLAHVTEVFEEESAKLGEMGAALAQTVERFGDPTELTSQLQKALSMRERLFGFSERVVLAPSLPPWRRALRHANLLVLGILAFVGGVFALALFFVSVFGLTGRAPRQDHGLPVGLIVFIYVLVNFWGIAFAASLLAQKVMEVVHGPVERFWTRVIFLAFISSFCVPVGILLYAGLTALISSADLIVELVSPISPLLLLGAPASVIYITLILRRTFYGPRNRPWCRIVAKGIFQFMGAALVAFALGLIILHDLKTSLRGGLSLFLLLSIHFLPLELLLAMPQTVAGRSRSRAECRCDDEWASLPINETGAAA